VVAVAAPGGEVNVAEGVCEGRIAFQPTGANGFGYDPVFFVDEYGCTMAELPDDVKNSISHRARALQAARPLIRAALHI
jgi:XTP/dITP diphosphohydrolase